MNRSLPEQDHPVLPPPCAPPAAAPPVGASPPGRASLGELTRRFWDADARRKRASDAGDRGQELGTVSAGPVVGLRDRLEKAHLRRVVRWGPRSRVLDLGGGAGRLALWLAPEVAEVVLVDASAELLAAARGEAERRGITNVRFVQAPVLDHLPEPGGFDLVLVFAMAMYLQDEELAPLARLCAGALAPGGRVVLKEPVTTDGRRRADERRDEAGNITYFGNFRPREAYPQAFAGALRLEYQQPTCAHLLPAALGGTEQAAAAARSSGLSAALEALAPVLVALDPSLQALERPLRAHRRSRRWLAPVPVLQDLYVFSGDETEPQTGPVNETEPHAPEPALSVVVIAYNEQECLVPVVRELRRALDEAEIDHELVLVDDGSVDATPQRMAELAEGDLRVQVHRQRNLGIGGALRTGFDGARGRHVTWIPADGQIPPEVVVELFGRRHEAPMLTTVYRTRDDPWYRTAISQTLNTLIRLRTGQVARSGGNYLFERRMWTMLGPRGDDTMMISTAFRQRLRDAGQTILEVEIDCRARRGGASKVLNARAIGRTLVGLLTTARARRR